MISLYQEYLSLPLKMAFGSMHGACRFHPTCSEYARLSFKGNALDKARGVLLSGARILSCNPLSSGGVHHASISFSPKLNALLCQKTPKASDINYILVPKKGKIFYILKALK